MHYEFSDARELFEAVRGAAKDRDRLERQALAMRTREGVRAASMQPRVAGTPDDYDRTAPTIERMAFEQASAERMLHDESLLEYGSALLYGRDGRGGLSDLMGPAVADVMFWRFCAALSWQEVADTCGYSDRQCMRLADQGLDACDFYGVSRLADGKGDAEG